MDVANKNAFASAIKVTFSLVKRTWLSLCLEMFTMMEALIV